MYAHSTFNTLKNIIMALCLMMFFISCNHKNKDDILFNYKGKYPDESVENMVITMSEFGKTSFIVEAPLMNKYYSDSSYSDCPKGIRISSFTESGQKQAIITADYAIEKLNKSYKASKNVVIIDVIKGDTLYTDEITWDQQKRTIFSNSLVKQAKADGSIHYGDGFTADERFTHYTIVHPRGVMAGFDF